MAMCVLDKQEIYWNDGNTPKGKGREIVGLGCRAEPPVAGLQGRSVVKACVKPNYASG
jgi:hypothetical protein